MTESAETNSNHPYWFVVAKGRNRLEEFVEEGFGNYLKLKQRRV